MAVLLAKIQKDLFDFTASEDPEDFGPLLNFWYRANSPAISAALSAQPGLKFIVDCPSAASLEHLTKKLLLLADTIVLRDLGRPESNETEPRQLVPISRYTPGYLNDVIKELEPLRPSLLTLLPPAPYWSSTQRMLKSGANAAYAMQFSHATPKELIDWIARQGREHIESGRVVYAPFIPPIEIEREFLRRGIDLPSYFNSSSFFHQHYEWMTEQSLTTLFTLKFPFLDGIDADTIVKVKEDYRDEFESFSRTLLNSIEGVKAAAGTDQFSSEVRHIQRNLVDASVSDVERTFKKIESLASLRRKGLLVGLLGLSAAAYVGAPGLAIVSGLAASGVKMVVDKIDQLKEQCQLREMKHYFLWRLKQETQ